MVSGQLEDSLRHDIESYIEGRLSGVKQEIAQLQSELNESLSRLMDRQAEVQLDGSVAASIQEHLRAAHEEGIDLAASESSRAKASSDMAIVKSAITEIDEQHSQAEILKALVNRAAAFAPRVAFFVIKGEQAIGWRARGFKGTVGDDAIRQVSISTSSDTTVSDVAHSKTTWSGGPGSHTENHLLLNHLGEEPPQRVVGIPLLVRGRTVAVLYADSAGLDSEAINLEALESLVRVAAMAVELLASRSVGRRPAADRGRADVSQSGEASSYVPAREYHEPQFQDSLSNFQDSQSNYQETPATFASEPQFEPQAQPETFESNAVPSYSEPQPVDTYTTAPEAEAVQEHVSSSISDVAPASSGKRRYGMDVDLPVEVSGEEERRLHNDARRFARLLVSEIKLYNEQKVMEGRSHQDLYERLREYIDRSREMYDKRVKPEVARKYDYFHHELVTTLAEGDAEKLGNAYPGATVTA